ncbi:hypothetical protein Scep_030556 [Stephania cephalantha]|uniref:Reverse transcriptase zinc-binding domain-containing protein n=1 Tax=Stephania cephalantha TaxID=152367 RepID=A0AAP0DZU2_9MAGN
MVTNWPWLEDRKKPGSSNPTKIMLMDKDQKGWEKIWKKLPCPPKIQFFGWKCLHELIPTNVFRVKRRVATISLCPMCNAEDESLIHLLFSCLPLLVGEPIWQESFENPRRQHL